MMGLGEPMTGQEGFPLPYTPLKPFGPAMAEMAGTGVHGNAATEKALTSAGIKPGEQPGANSITLQEAKDILSAIDKLKGAVYLLEDIVSSGFTESSVAVGLTKAIDKATIVNAVRGTKLANRIRFIDLSSGTIPPGSEQVAGSTEQAPAPTPQPAMAG
jgi:hypothetical protein